MRFNVGTPDRLARIVIGAVLVLLPFFSGLGLFAYPAWFWTSVVVGAVLIATALVRFCPLYAILRVTPGRLPPKDTDGKTYLKVPVNGL